MRRLCLPVRPATVRHGPAGGDWLPQAASNAAAGSGPGSTVAAAASAVVGAAADARPAAARPPSALGVPMGWAVFVACWAAASAVALALGRDSSAMER